MEHLYAAGDFEAFWVEYEKLHASRPTRRAHAIATASAVALVGAAVVTRRPLLLFVAPIVDYAIAQSSHRAEGQATQPWRKPSWHLYAELRLFSRTLKEEGARGLSLLRRRA